MQRKRLVIWLMMLLMVIGMSVTVFAKGENGDGMIGKIEYTYVVDYDDYDAVGQIRTTDKSVQVAGKLSAVCWCSGHSEELVKYDYGTGKGKVDTYLDSDIPYDEEAMTYSHRCFISRVTFKATIGGTTKTWNV